MLDIETKLNMNPKAFWSFISSKKNGHAYPSRMYYNDEFGSSYGVIANLFARYFQYSYAPDSLMNSNIFSSGEFSLLEFSENDIFIALSSLTLNNSVGPDNIPAIFLKNCSSSLAGCLKCIFNISLKTGYFPIKWKSSLIIPIFKTGDRSCVSNYRGISILSTIPKLFEKLVYDFLIVKVANSISSKQHGFFPGRSTTTNLTLLSHTLFVSLEKGSQVDVIYTDFSKAFDRVNQKLLLFKLNSYNIPEIPVNWLMSYLLNRVQYVKLGEIISKDLINVTSGVPQGSHLGPLLFLLFINDVITCFSFCDTLLYADDLKIFAEVNCLNDCLLIQQDLLCFARWCNSNCLALNVGKCKVMSYRKKNSFFSYDYTLFDELVDRVLLFKDLGVTFCYDLSFKLHIDEVVAKSLCMLGLIKRFSKYFVDPYTIKSLYISFVRSQLIYACIIWNPFSAVHSMRIESVQKKFLLYSLRRLPRADPSSFVLPSYKSRCLLINIPTVEVFRDVQCALFVFDILTGKISCPELLEMIAIYVPFKNFRNSNFIRLPYRRTDYGRSDPILNVSRVFNRVFDGFDFGMSRNMFRDFCFEFFGHL